MTDIEWVKNKDGTRGKSWNVVTGCTPISEGCANCYAKRMAKRLAGRYGYPESPHEFDVTLHPDRLEEPLRWKKPTTIFVCSMSDLFHNDVPYDYILDVFNVIAKCPQHIFQILTKRPERMKAVLEEIREGRDRDITWTGSYPSDAFKRLREWPWSNVWLGVTAENQKWADERTAILLQIPAVVHFVSAEPLLSSIDFEMLDWAPKHLSGFPGSFNALTGMWWPAVGNCDEEYHNRIDMDMSLDLVIVGGESGPGARPMNLKWARSLIRQCKNTGVKVFIKQLGSAWAANNQPLGLLNVTVKQMGDSKGHLMENWPEDLRVREMPDWGQSG